MAQGVKALYSATIQENVTCINLLLDAGVYCDKPDAVVSGMILYCTVHRSKPVNTSSSPYS